MTNDLDTSIRPGKWIKRGPQPEVPATPPLPSIAIAKLLAEIRECTNTKEKEILEAKFNAECATYDALHPDSLPIDAKKLCEDFTASLRPIIGADFGLSISENATQHEWVAMHHQLLQCKRHAAQWLSKSRKFASDKWGVDFVAESEAQLELELGIERKPTVIEDDVGVMVLAKAHRIASMVASISKGLGGSAVTIPSGVMGEIRVAMRPVGEFLAMLEEVSE
jgi:hypothetical protein